MKNVIRMAKMLGACFSCGSEQARYEARHRMVTALASKWGFRVYASNLAWHRDGEYKRAWEEGGNAARPIHERKFNLYNLARNLRGVPGDIAECGVYQAASSYLMLVASKGTGKHFYGFDSFEGLSEPQASDKVGTGRTFQWKKNDLAVPEDLARKNLTYFDGQYTLLKGWIPERFGEVTNKTFSLVHIDVDLYDPTKEAVTFFWPRMSAGGMIVCDDYGFDSCPGARKAMDEFGESIGQAVIHLTTGQGILIKR